MSSSTGLDDRLELRVGRDPWVPLRFLGEAGRVWVIASSPPGRWFARALSIGACEIRFSGEPERTRSVVLVTQAEVATRVRAGFLAKYGPTIRERYFAGEEPILQLDPATAPTPHPPLDLVRAEFDAVASEYECRVISHPIDAYLKQRAFGRLRSSLDRLDPLLEVGPGVGLETLPLLRAGHRITAVDVSPRMIERLVARGEAGGVSERLDARVGALGDLDRCLSDLETGHFAGAYSTFGAFNLEPDLSMLGPAIGRLIRPGGRLLFTTLNRPGPVALGADLLMGRLRAAGARLRPSVAAGRMRYPLPVYLRRPGEWDARLAPNFRRVGAWAVSVLAPPYESDRAVRALGAGGGRRLARLDERLSGHSSLATLGEWALLEYERVPA